MSNKPYDYPKERQKNLSKIFAKIVPQPKKLIVDKIRSVSKKEKTLSDNIMTAVKNNEDQIKIETKYFLNVSDKDSAFVDFKQRLKENYKDILSVEIDQVENNYKATSNIILKLK